MKKLLLFLLLISTSVIFAQVQYRTPTLVICNLESDRNLNWGEEVNIHTLEQGTPALTKGHWWKILNGAFVEIPIPAIVVDNKLFSQIANQTIGNTTSATTLMGTGIGSKDLLPNVLIVGSEIKIIANGYCSTVSGTALMRIKLGAISINAPTITPLVGTNRGWALEYVFTVRSVGVSGTIIGQGRWVNTFTGAMTQIVSTTTTTINTTILQSVDVTWAWSIANAGNTITSTNCTIRN